MNELEMKDWNSKTSTMDKKVQLHIAQGKTALCGI